MKRIPQLDGLRGTAILGVLLFHLLPHYESIATLFPRPVLAAIRLGQTGVDLFFVLSGFLITGILMESRDRADRWSTFFARRSLRIFPLYFLTLFIVFILLPDFLKLRTLSQYQIWAWLYVCNIGYTFGYCPDFGHLWSLAVEEQFYLIWPFCVWSVRSHRGVAILSVITMLIAIVSRVVALDAEVFPAFFTLCRLDSLAAGGLVAALVRMPVNQHRLFHWFAAQAVASLVCAVPLYMLGSGSGAGWQQVVKFLLFALAYSGIVGVTVTGGANILNRCLSWQWLRWFGNYSYCLYLVHPFLMTSFSRWFPEKSLPSELIACVGTFVGSMILAKVSGVFFEQPIHGLKERWFPSQTAVRRAEARSDEPSEIDPARVEQLVKREQG